MEGGLSTSGHAAYTGWAFFPFAFASKYFQLCNFHNMFYHSLWLVTHLTFNPTDYALLLYLGLLVTGVRGGIKTKSNSPFLSFHQTTHKISTNHGTGDTIASILVLAEDLFWLQGKKDEFRRGYRSLSHLLLLEVA
jgi:hypothetical protein